jgi:hypothetical protein
MNYDVRCVHLLGRDESVRVDAGGRGQKEVPLCPTTALTGAWIINSIAFLT